MSWDAEAAVWVSTHRIGVLNDPSVWLGTIEKLGAVWIAFAIAVAAHRRDPALRILGLAVATAATTFLADAAAFALKDATHRQRPFEAHPQIHPLYVVHSSSFPAGHAATAFAGATLLSAASPRLAPAFFSLATLIAASRVYDGVHYPTDVLAGAVLGALVAAVAVVLLRHTPLSSARLIRQPA